MSDKGKDPLNKKSQKEKKDKKDKNKKDKFNGLLKPCHIESIKFANKKAKVYSKNVKDLLLAKIIGWGYNKKHYKKLLKKMKHKIVPVIHFSLSSFEKFKNDVRYKSTFEVMTGKSDSYRKWRNDKDKVMFNNNYEKAQAQDKVKYGALNMLMSKKGILSALSYGRCHMILKEEVKKRITFVHQNSNVDTIHIANYKYFDHILYYLPDNVLKEMINETGTDINYKYVECQIHGDVCFNRDIEEIMVPRAMKGASTANIEAFCKLNNIEIDYY